jgi:chemotaxis protein MotB
VTRHWQRKREVASHADDWLMTYADMITLLLCFFAIFVIVSTGRKNLPQKLSAPQALTVTAQIPPLVQQAQVLLPPVQPPAKLTDAARVDPPFPEVEHPVEAAAAAKAPPKTTESARWSRESGGGETAAAVPPGIVTPPRMITPPKPDEPPPQATAPAAAETAPVEAVVPPDQAPTETPPASLPEIVDHLKSTGAADIEQKGDRITTLEMSSAAFFDSGSASLSSAGKSILADVAVNLKSDRFEGYQITVEGHTDDSPINTAQFPSNWELSTARASAVVHFFLDQGVSAQKLRAAGYADTFPKLPNRDTKGNAIPENQAQNRRVVIKLEKIEKAEP